jgi:dephospho-CoA kinase
LKIGIFGKSGSGKTTVAKFFEEKGFSHINLDGIGRSIPEKYPQVIADIERIFGADYISNGQIDRKKLGTLVFNNTSELEKLNGIFFGYIVKEAIGLLEKYPDCVVEGAILIESGLNEYMDKIIYVKTGLETALRRIMHRESISKEQASQRINAQSKYDDMEKSCDFVIETTDSIEELHSKIDRLFKDLKL